MQIPGEQQKGKKVGDCRHLKW